MVGCQQSLCHRLTHRQQNVTLPSLKFKDQAESPNEVYVVLKQFTANMIKITKSLHNDHYKDHTNCAKIQRKHGGQGSVRLEPKGQFEVRRAGSHVFQCKIEF